LPNDDKQRFSQQNFNIYFHIFSILTPIKCLHLAYQVIGKVQNDFETIFAVI